MNMLKDEQFLQKQKEKLLKNLERLEKANKSYGKKTNGKFKVQFPDIGSGEDDNIQEVVQYEENVSIENNLSKMIEKHKKALNKIEKGAYGLCEVCKKEINQARLEAFPEAEYCAQHAK